MHILIFVIIYTFGLIMGYYAHWWAYEHKSGKYGGTILVSKDEVREKTIYSLELDDYPEKLQSKKEVLFKVVRE